MAWKWFLQRIFCAVLAILCCSVQAGLASDGLRISVGSCHDLVEVPGFEHVTSIEGTVWEQIYNRKPDAYIWGGDNVYGDSRPFGFDILWSCLSAEKPKNLKCDKMPPYYHATPKILEDVYKNMSNYVPYKTFVDSIGQKNIFGTWDDHDFGLNDAGGMDHSGFPYRMESQQKFLDFFHVPKDDPRRHRQGVYSSAIVPFRQGNQYVKLIMLDNRYFKDDYSNATGDFLGEEQWKWFESELNDRAAEGAAALIVVAGLQMLPNEAIKTMLGENWNKLPVARDRLLKTIASSKAKGVVLYSGDVHFTQMLAARCGDEKSNFVLPELTASGMTHSWADHPYIGIFAMALYHIVHPWPFEYNSHFSMERNFGEFEFNLDDKHNLKSITIRSFKSTGELLFEETFPIQSLKSKAVRAQCLPTRNFSSTRILLHDILSFAITLSPAVAIPLAAYLVRGKLLSQKSKQVRKVKAT